LDIVRIAQAAQTRVLKSAEDSPYHTTCMHKVADAGVEDALNYLNSSGNEDISPYGVGISLNAAGVKPGNTGAAGKQQPSVVTAKIYGPVMNALAHITDYAGHAITFPYDLVRATPGLHLDRYLPYASNPGEAALPYTRALLSHGYGERVASDIDQATQGGIAGAALATAVLPVARVAGGKLMRMGKPVLDKTRTTIRKTPQYTRFAQKAPRALGQRGAAVVGDKDYEFFKYLYGDRYYPQLTERFTHINGSPVDVYSLDPARQAIAQYTPMRIGKNRMPIYAKGIRKELRDEIRAMRVDSKIPQKGYYLSSDRPVIAPTRGTILGYSTVANNPVGAYVVPHPGSGSFLVDRNGRIHTADGSPLIVASRKKNPLINGFHELGGHNFGGDAVVDMLWNNSEFPADLSYGLSRPGETLGTRAQLIKAMNKENPRSPVPVSITQIEETAKNLSAKPGFLRVSDQVGNIPGDLGKLRQSVPTPAFSQYTADIGADKLARHARDRIYRQRANGRKFWNIEGEADDAMERAYDRFHRWWNRHKPDIDALYAYQQKRDAATKNTEVLHDLEKILVKGWSGIKH